MKVASSGNVEHREPRGKTLESQLKEARFSAWEPSPPHTNPLRMTSNTPQTPILQLNFSPLFPSGPFRRTGATMFDLLEQAKRYEPAQL